MRFGGIEAESGSKMSGSTNTIRQRLLSSCRNTRQNSSTISSRWNLVSIFGFYVCFLSMTIAMVNSFSTISTRTSKLTVRTQLLETRRMEYKSSLTKAKVPGYISESAKGSDSSLRAHENKEADDSPRRFKHTLAILSMPYTSTDKIANEAILDQAIQHTRKLSVVLRCQNDDDRKAPSLSRLRRYVGEVYSTLWDAVSLADKEDNGDDSSEFCDVVVYPQNLPNAAPESWIHDVAKDLDSVCSHDSICGWISSSAMGRGKQFQFSEGMGAGGLDAHVQAINADRKHRNLSEVVAIHVDPWPTGASSEWQNRNNVVFLDDDATEEEDASYEECNIPNDDFNEDLDTDTAGMSLMGGARIPKGSLFRKVAVAGTFDGMHYGHRKLLTLAISSVSPHHGQLLVGVTVDEMLQHKSYAEDIPNLEERMKGARNFIYRLAPGFKNRVRFIPISDEYGPPGTLEEGENFDALVLSHETLDNGHKLNEHRVQTLGLEPLTLLCTRRTEPHGMSSTALRQRRRDRKLRREKVQSASS